MLYISGKIISCLTIIFVHNPACWAKTLCQNSNILERRWISNRFNYIILYINTKRIAVLYVQVQENHCQNHTGCSTCSVQKLIVDSLASRIQLSMSELPTNLLWRTIHSEQIERPTAPHVYRTQYRVILRGFWCLETLKAERNIKIKIQP